MTGASTTRTNGDWTTPGPTGRVTAVAAVGAGLVPALLAGVDTAASLAGLAGLGLVAAGAFRERRVLVTVGALALFGAVLLAGVAGVGSGSVLASGAGVLLAWTFGHESVDVRDAVGPAPTTRQELAHVAGTGALVGGVAAAVWLLSTIPWGTLPPLAVALLVLGGLVLAAVVGT